VCGEELSLLFGFVILDLIEDAELAISNDQRCPCDRDYCEYEHIPTHRYQGCRSDQGSSTHRGGRGYRTLSAKEQQESS
jgi:hypothetical protein